MDKRRVSFPRRARPGPHLYICNPPSIHPSLSLSLSLSLSQLPHLGFVLARPCNKASNNEPPGSPAASFESDRPPARPPIHPSAAPKHEVPARHDPTRPTALQPAALTSHPRTPVHRLLRRRSRFVLAAPRKANEGWEKRCRAAETFGSCQGSMDTRLSARLSRGLDSRRPGTVMQVSQGEYHVVAWIALAGTVMPMR